MWRIFHSGYMTSRTLDNSQDRAMKAERGKLVLPSDEWGRLDVLRHNLFKERIRFLFTDDPDGGALPPPPDPLAH